MNQSIVILLPVSNLTRTHSGIRIQVDISRQEHSPPASTKPEEQPAVRGDYWLYIFNLLKINLRGRGRLHKCG